MNKLRTEGQCNVEFDIPAPFREAFKLHETKKFFQTHRELDEFVTKLFEKEPQFETKYRQEYALLKRLD